MSVVLRLRKKFVLLLDLVKN